MYIKVLYHLLRVFANADAVLGEDVLEEEEPNEGVEPQPLL